MRYHSGSGEADRVHDSDPAYYTWDAPGQTLTIRLALDVVSRLDADVMKGFWAVPKRGMEEGGILLGRVVQDPNPVVTIEGYEPVLCEHRRGPSYVFSDSDRRRLEKVLRRKRVEQVVGFYRSHTRPGLYLDEDDYALIRAYFPDPRHVCLLVRPHASGPSVAGFFFWEEGEIRRQAPYQQFTFHGSELLKGAGRPESPAARAQPAAEPEPLPTDRPGPWVEPAPKPRQPWAWRIQLPAIAFPRMRWQTIVTAGLAAFTVGALEYQILSQRPEPPPPAGMPDLRVERNGRDLRVNWNRDAPSVLKAERAFLFITEGGQNKQLLLDSGQLRYGSVSYSPESEDVSFRLELHAHNKTVSEALTVLVPRSHSQPALTPAPARPAPVAPPADRKATTVANGNGVNGDQHTSRLASAKAANGAPEAVRKPKRRPARFYDDGL
jgi:hypothetical protein